MTNFSTKILNVLTFGLLGYFAKQTINKQNKTANAELKVSSDIDFDFDKLILALGGNANIDNVSNTINSIIVKIYNLQLLDKKELAKFSKKGIMLNQYSITIVVGNIAKAVAEKMAQQIKND